MPFRQLLCLVAGSGLIASLALLAYLAIVWPGVSP